MRSRSPPGRGEKPLSPGALPRRAGALVPVVHAVAATELAMHAARFEGPDRARLSRRTTDDRLVPEAVRAEDAAMGTVRTGDD